MMLFFLFNDLAEVSTNMMKVMAFLAVFGLMFMMVYAGDDENVRR